MKTIIILTVVDFYKGTSAAAARLNNYAKSLAAIDENKVFFISLRQPLNSLSFLEKERNIFVLKRETSKDIGYYSLFKIQKMYTRLKSFLATKENVAVIYYPTSIDIFYNILLLYNLKHYNIYCEVNEVRKYAYALNIVSWIYAYLFEFLLPYYKGCIYISRNIASFYRRKNKNSIIVPILSDVGVKRTSEKEFKAIPNFVFAGTISIKKENLKELLYGFSSFSLRKKARLSFYGEISSRDKIVLNKLIQQLGIEKLVTFYGRVSHKKIQDVLKDADGLILPRENNNQNKYGFSTKLSEYIVSGTPIILTDTGVISYYFKDNYNCIMVHGFDRNAFCKAFIRYTEKSATELLEIAHNAFVMARNSFDYRCYSNMLNEFVR